MCHGYFTKMINSNSTAIAGAIAIKGSPSAPFNFASNTTEPVANTISIKVPMSSAKKIFLFLSSLIFQ